MSKPTVIVVVNRIRSLLKEQPEILQEVEDQVHYLLLKIEDLASYLEELGEEKDEERLHNETDNESEDEIPNFILKVGSESKINRKTLERFLIEIAYKSEDVIDTIIYKNIDEGLKSCCFLKSNVCRPCSRTEPQEMLTIDSIIKKLEKALNDMKALYPLGTTKPAQYDKLGSWDERLRRGLPPTPSTPHRLVGIQKDIDTLVDKLTRKGNQAHVLYMVGREGSGKTTMASEIYNHPAIKRHFASLVWADASQPKDAKQILLEIIRQTQGREVQHLSQSTTELVNKLSHITKQRPYLIILDDVENPDALATHILPMIQSSRNNSKIVIITRFFPHHPYKHEEYVVGSEEDVDSLAEKLIMKDTHETSIFHTPQKQATVLLLEELYENPIVCQHFDFRKWIHIADGSDTKTIMLKVLEVITNNKSLAKENTETLVEKLQAGLRSKKYLIVLDQVEKPQFLLDILHPILTAAEHRSKVILITNNPPSQLQNSDITGEELLDADRLARRLTGEGDQPLFFSIIDLDNSGCKTALARELYDHPSVSQHFDAKVWITISKDWDAHAALSQIIRHITGNDPLLENSSTEKLAKLLLSILAQKMYLLVLDDIGDAEDLVYELMAESSRTSHQRKETHKSKVIITADNPRTIQQSNLKSFLYVVRPLTEDESWELLCSIAVKHAANTSTAQQIVSEFDREPPENRFQKYKVLTKCKGIPLAIVALGGLLSTKGTFEEWIYVFTCLRAVETPLHDVLDDILSLCYDGLPAGIIPCFLYLGLFPKQPEIPTGMLVRMWISEGLVTFNPPFITGQTLEDMATNYLEELARRCMIQVVRRNHIGQMKHIRLHDQMHQLSIKRSAELGFLQKYPFIEMIEKPLNRAGLRDWEDVLHIREMLLRRTTVHYGEQIKYPRKSSNLRSFVQFGKHGVSGKCYYFQHDTPTLRLEPIHEHFKLLKVLILSGIRTSNTLPKSIGYLIFLTYLGLRATNIQVLPESMSNLRKLVTLDYRGTLEPSICAPLPNILSQMTGLRHLFLPECAISSTKTLDPSILCNLQTLWGVSGGDWITKDFVKLSPSLVKLGLVRISSRKELEAIIYWLTLGSKQLRILKLDWHTADKGRLQFPENLHNFQHLHKLALIGRLKEEYDFTLLPSLVKLELFFSHLEKYDPTEKLGRLPCLKILILWNSYKGSRWTCGSESFLELEELQISHLPNLEEWIVEEGAMPKLKQLSIFNCRKLKRLPEGLSCLNLQKLEILDMPRPFCNKLQERIHRITAEGDLHTIPNIKFEAHE